MREIIVLNLHILPIVFNCGLPQKYYCAWINSFLKFGHIFMSYKILSEYVEVLKKEMNVANLL